MTSTDEAPDDELTSTGREPHADGADKAASSFSNSIQRLIDEAVEQGRDGKLIVALFVTLTEFIAERGADVVSLESGILSPGEPDDEGQEEASDEEPSSRLRLRPEYRAHIEALIDSFSDDETAWFLGIGVRQVRRRAQSGDLHFFTVGKRRRYPTWQLDSRYGTAPGIRDVAHAVPTSWSPARTQRFLTTLESGLELHGKPITPVAWLRAGGDASRIIRLIEQIEDAGHGQNAAESVRSRARTRLDPERPSARRAGGLSGSS